MNHKMDCEFCNESMHQYQCYGVSTAMQDLSLVWQYLQLTEAHKGSGQDHIFPVCQL
jgi:hypothetical protein